MRTIRIVTLVENNHKSHNPTPGVALQAFSSSQVFGHVRRIGANFFIGYRDTDSTHLMLPLILSNRAKSERYYAMSTQEPKPNCTAAARAALKASGKSPTALGEQNREDVVVWVYPWGLTSSGIVQELLDRSAGGYASKLARSGYLVETKPVSQLEVKSYFTLSQKGLELAVKHAPKLIHYREIKPGVADQLRIRHNLLAQQLTLHARKAGKLLSFEPDRSAPATKAGEKRPDVKWVLRSRQRLGVELELSPKWSRDLDQFVYSIWQSLVPNNTGVARFDRYVLVTDTPSIFERYQQHFRPNAVVTTWAKDANGKWKDNGELRLPADVSAKISFEVL